MARLEVPGVAVPPRHSVWHQPELHRCPEFARALAWGGGSAARVDLSSESGCPPGEMGIIRSMFHVKHRPQRRYSNGWGGRRAVASRSSFGFNSFGSPLADVSGWALSPWGAEAFGFPRAHPPPRFCCGVDVVRLCRSRLAWDRLRQTSRGGPVQCSERAHRREVRNLCHCRESGPLPDENDSAANSPKHQRTFETEPTTIEHHAHHALLHVKHRPPTRPQTLIRAHSEPVDNATTSTRARRPQGHTIPRTPENRHPRPPNPAPPQRKSPFPAAIPAARKPDSRLSACRRDSTFF